MNILADKNIRLSVDYDNELNIFMLRAERTDQKPETRWIWQESVNAKDLSDMPDATEFLLAFMHRVTDKLTRG